MPELPKIAQPSMSPERASGAMIAPPSVSGLQAVAGAVRSIADRELKQKERMLEMDEANKLLEIESEYNQMMAKTKNGFSINNPDSWQYDDAHNAYIDGIDYTGARPEFQQRVKLSLAQRKARLDEGLIGEKFATKAKIFTGNVQNQIAMALDVNDYQGARETLAKYGPAMRLRSDELEKMQLNIDRAERNASIEDMIAEGDVESIDSLQGITTSDKLKYKKAADVNRRYYEKEAVQNVYEQLEKKKSMSEQELTEKLLDPRISETTRSQFLKNWKDDQPITWDEKTEITQELSSLFKARKSGMISDEDYARKHHDISTKVYALANRPGSGGLRKRVYDLDPAGWSNGVPGGGKKTEAEIELDETVKFFFKAKGAGTQLGDTRDLGKGRTEEIKADEQLESFQQLREKQARIRQGMEEWKNSVPIEVWSDPKNQRDKLVALTADYTANESFSGKRSSTREEDEMTALRAIPFDPEGTGYDYVSAIAAGLGPDEEGHWPSRNPKTGQILKGKKHPSFSKTVAGEEEVGFEIYTDPETGKVYSREKTTPSEDIPTVPPPLPVK